MLGFGFLELCLITTVILVIFKPKDLPALARNLARVFYEFKNIFSKLQKEWKISLKDQELKK